MLTLVVLTILSVLALFSLTPPWRQALAIAAFVIVVILWLAWLGAIAIPGHYRLT